VWVEDMAGLVVQSVVVSIQRCRPTQRALDAGDSAPSQAVFYASAFFCSDGVPASAPAPVTRTVGRSIAYEKEALDESA